jgi:hypothetical protein
MAQIHIWPRADAVWAAPFDSFLIILVLAARATFFSLLSFFSSGSLAEPGN